jgi:hypothetical protein
MSYQVLFGFHINPSTYIYIFFSFFLFFFFHFFFFFWDGEGEREIYGSFDQLSNSKIREMIYGPTNL